MTMAGAPPEEAVVDAVLLRPTIIVIFDSVRDEMTVVTPARPAAGPSAPASAGNASRPFGLSVAHAPA